MFRRTIGLIWVACAGVASAVTINVTMNTSALVQNTADQPYHIQMLLVNAELLTSHNPGGPFVNPSNTVTASNFLFGGGFGIDPMLDPGYLIDGGASGDIRSLVHLEANHATNYFSQGFVPGSTLSFTLDYTHNTAVSHSIFDVFSFTIIDSQYTGLPTAGGQNHNAFLEIDFDSDDPHVLTFPSDPNTPTSAGVLLDIPAPTFASVSATIPEPGTFYLGGAACLALLFGRKFGHKLRKAVPVSVAAIVLLASTNLFAAPAELSPEVFEGKFRGRDVKYQVLNGLAIVGGDMVIGEATIEEGLDGVRTSRLTTHEVDATTGKTGSKRYSHSVEGSAHLWPKVNGIVTVPYKITRGSQTMTTALSQFNAQFAGRIQWVPRTNQRAYVDINLAGQSSNSCYATLGYTGSVSILQGVDGGCAVFAMLHEMGHVLGFAHEQSRADRDRYLSIDYSNIAFGSRGAYDQEISDNVDIGLFDYVSLMHYAPRGFGRNGNPEMESIPTGIPFGDPPTWSPGDLDAINRLYFTAPTAVTVDTAPTGLPIIVDGLTYIAPRTFNWALNSTHTLNVVSGPQTTGGSTYLFGRWNSDINADLNPSRQITVTPGNGSFGHAAGAPDVTVYTANYIKLTPFNPTYILDNFFSTAAQAGTVSTNPNPRTFPGVQGTFFVDRQLVTLTATPAAGKNFYSYEGDNTFLQTFGQDTNPLTLPSDMLAGNFYVQFTSRPEVVITTNVRDNNASGIEVTADGADTRPLPTSWSVPYDSAWGPSTTHTLVAASPVSPRNDSATRYTFAAWSDGVTAPSRNLQVPASGALVIGANYSTAYRVTANVGAACAGRVAVTPNLPQDLFITRGAQVSFSAIPTAPWVFAGWSGTQTSSANPLVVNMNAEVVATANFNLTNSPLTITSISPPNIRRGSAAQTITISGSGFTPTTDFYLNNSFVQPTYVNSTTLTATVPASSFAVLGDLSTIAEHDQGTCSVYVFGPSLHVIP